MSSLKTIVGSVVAFALLAGAGSASATTSGSIYASNSGVSLSFSYFEDDLAPYGEWVDYAPYGECWVPAHTPHGWRPYYDGYWAYTDVGWSWVSNEPWGWATYHYGRWAYDPHYGWLWVPGTVWAPSWVAWHTGGGYVGWAPLPPAAHWSFSVGLNYGCVETIPVHDWCFVEQRHFTHSKIKHKVIHTSHNDVIYHRTKNVTRYDTWDGHPRNVGIDVASVDHWGGGKVKRMHVAEAREPRKGRGEQVRGNSVEYYRPQFTKEKSARSEELVRSESKKGGAVVRGDQGKRRDAVVRTDGAKRPVEVASREIAQDRKVTKKSTRTVDREVAMLEDSGRERVQGRNAQRVTKQRSVQRSERSQTTVQRARRVASERKRVEARTPVRRPAEVSKERKQVQASANASTRRSGRPRRWSRGVRRARSASRRTRWKKRRAAVPAATKEAAKHAEGRRATKNGQAKSAKMRGN